MKLGQIKGKKEIMMAVAYHTATSIFGPLVLFGGLGYFADRQLDTKPLYMLIGVGVAFIFTNILTVKKAREISKDMLKHVEPLIDKENKEKNN